MKGTSKDHKRKRVLSILVVTAIIVIVLIISGFSSFDVLVKYDKQIKTNHLSVFKITDAKIDYEVNIRKSNKPYDYIEVSGYIPSSIKAKINRIKTNSNEVALNLYTSKNLIYMGTKSTRIILYLRDASDLKKMILNGKKVRTDKKVIYMPGIGN